MKVHIQVFLILFFFFPSTYQSNAQNIDTIFGCDDFPQSAAEISSCTICNFDILYGTTFPFTPSPDAGWCGSVENDQYIGFVVGPSGEVVFSIESFGCLQGQGVQVGIYDQNNQLVGDCFNQVTPSQPQGFSASNLTPNTTYFLRIDGFAGDGCEFNIQAISGLANNGIGTFETVIIGNQSVIQYVPSPCFENTPTLDTIDFDGCLYRADYILQPDTLPYDVRTTTDLDSFQVITWPDSMEQRVLLLLDLELIQNDPSGSCPDSLLLPYYSHFLDLDVNASISTKAWACDSERLVGTIQGSSGSDQLHLLESGTQDYTLSGAGYHGFGGGFDDVLFDYRIVQGSTVLSLGSFTENDFEESFTVNHDDGPVVIQFDNPRDWQMEVAIERASPAQPWSLNDIFDQDIASECVSATVSALEIISPNYSQIQNANLSFEFGFVSNELINTSGTNFPTSPVLRSTLGNPTLRIDSIALPGELPPGAYVFKATIIPLDDLTPLCGSNDDFDLWYEFNITEPTDTVLLPDLFLSAQGDSVTLFSTLSLTHQIETNVTGAYYAYFNCSVYIQYLLPPPINVNLGVDSLCAGECLFAPTGETISCISGSYSFLANNDTTYFGDLYVDTSDPLSAYRIDYICDSLNGEWYIDMAWTGSYGPYVLDGQTFADTTGQAGPFQNGQTVDISLYGSSPCVDTLYINGSYSCISNTTSIQSYGLEVTQRSTSLLEVSAPAYGWKIQLVDVLGREVMTTSLQQGTNQLFVGDLLKGTYFIVVQNGNQSASEKWVKR